MPLMSFIKSSVVRSPSALSQIALISSSVGAGSGRLRISSAFLRKCSRIFGSDNFRSPGGGLWLALDGCR